MAANATRVCSCVAPKIRAAMEATATDRVLGLCSGGGGPWSTLQPELAKSGPATVVLSDLYPNIEALRRARVRSQGRLDLHSAAVDAANVPVELDGVRTMFNAFHHFPPECARAILADAIAKRRPIVVFEGANNRALGVLAMPFQLSAILLLTPFVRPFRWSRLVFTYFLPLVPGTSLIDGAVSFLRLYLEDELHELVQHAPGQDHFQRDIGSTRAHGVPCCSRVFGRAKSRHRRR